MRYLPVALLSVLALTSAAPAQRAPAVTACAISAYESGGGVAGGVNVRAAPSTQARVLLNLRPEGTPVFDITGHSNGWFRISRAIEAESEERIFTGTGWVHRSNLGMRVAHYDPRLFSAPSRRSRVLANLGGQEPDVTLLSCSGEWVQVRAGSRIGWLPPGAQCTNPLTTCA